MSNIDTPDDDDILSQDPYERYFEQLLIDEEQPPAVHRRVAKPSRAIESTRNEDDDESSNDDEDDLGAESSSMNVTNVRKARLSSMEFCEADSTRNTGTLEDYAETRAHEATNSAEDQYATMGTYEEEDEGDGSDDSSDDYYDPQQSDQSSVVNQSQLFDKLFMDDGENLFSKKDELKMIYMRSYLNKRDEEFKEKDELTLRIRQEVVSCRERIEALERKRDDTYEQLTEAQFKNDITTANRLNAEHENLCREIDLETNVLEKLNETYSQADYERSKALLEKSKYILTNIELTKNEKELDYQKAYRSTKRLMDENRKVDTIKAKLDKAKKEEQEKVEAEASKIKRNMEQAKLAREVTSEYLKRTLRDIKKTRETGDDANKKLSDLRRTNLLKLKETIDHNKEIFQAKVLKARHAEKLKSDQLEGKKAEIESRGENPNFYLTRQAKLAKVEKQKKEFEQAQEKNTKEIVKKILKENENLANKKKLYPVLFAGATEKSIGGRLDPIEPSLRVGKSKRRTRQTTEDATNHLHQLLNPDEAANGLSDDATNELIEQRSLMESTTIASKDENDDEDEDEAYVEGEHQAAEKDCVVKPEFEGLWEKKAQRYDAENFYKNQYKFPEVFKSKAERELYLKTLDKLKKSAIKDQVVAGRKFEGTSFKSNPKTIHFKDFDVDQTYTLKVVLTNISYTINTCKLVGMSENLKDFVHVNFQPPGQLSAGLTCDFTITFEPKINKDLIGEIIFLSTNGQFTVPVKCTIKKCDLSVNSKSVYFGTSVIGERLVRKIQLINKGALGTDFRVEPVLETPREGDQKASVGDELASLKGSAAEMVFKESDENGSLKGSLKRSELDQSEPERSVIELGQVREGFIGPFATVDVEFIFAPTYPGKFEEKFAIKFDDHNSEEIPISVKATAIDLPIWIENLNIDLKICMYDRLYQDVVRVHNRANAALRITFEIPHELRNHLEILPKTAFIQAKSEFFAQVKFIPRKSLEQDAGEMFEKETGVLEVPLRIKVADQNKTVNYSLHAIVTTSDLEFDTTEIDFGYCSIYESVRATVSLTNKSILCQPFGFIKLNDYVNVQPNDGFGTLLPNETIKLDINFSPKLAKEYNFTLTCKSAVNRDFFINCKGVAVHPPLKLSAQRLNFRATSLNTTNFKTLYVVNEHVDYDEHRHPVPRIGSGEIARVGPTKFEFDLPEGCPVKISPMVGTVAPGQKVKVTVEYKAVLNEAEIKREAFKALKAKVGNKFNTSVESSNLSELQSTETFSNPNLKKSTNSSSSKPKLVKASSKTTLSTNTFAAESSKTLEKQDSVAASLGAGAGESKSPDLENIDTRSPEYFVGQMNALRNYEGKCERYQIACYVSDASSEEKASDLAEENADASKKPGSTSYSVHNTLYLDVVCPSVKPELIVINQAAAKGSASGASNSDSPVNQKHSTKGTPTKAPAGSPAVVAVSQAAVAGASQDNVVDFGKVSIGHKAIRTIGVKNTSSQTVNLSSNLLDTNGPFVLLNSLRSLEPNAVHNLIIAFIPHKNHIFRELFELRTEKSNLTFVLTAVGIEPSFSLTYLDGSSAASSHHHAANAGAELVNCLDFGYCISNDRCEKTIEMRNNSKISIEFQIEMLSAGDEARKQNELKRFLSTAEPGARPVIGPRNHNGTSPFDVFPVQGVIAAGQKIDLTLVFQPDHESELYSDEVFIRLKSSEFNSRRIQLVGKSRSRSYIYVRGVDQLSKAAKNAGESTLLQEFESGGAAGSGEETSSTTAAAKATEKEKESMAGGGKEQAPPQPQAPVPVLVQLLSTTNANARSQDEFTTAERVIQIGCMRANFLGSEGGRKEVKKNGEFAFENLKEINAKGFSIDLAKSAIEPGGERNVKITWKPPAGFEMNQSVLTSVTLTTKSNNQTEYWRLMLYGRIVASQSGSSSAAAQTQQQSLRNQSQMSVARTQLGEE